tara:strand:+ start:289 stop:492 length:204 start_codon:yes stop_codon:yes gene_type:complete
MLGDIIQLTFEICDYRDCDEKCMDYLMDIGFECSIVFNNKRYSELWITLYNICNEIGEQTSPFYLDK